MLMIDGMKLLLCRVCHFKVTFLADLHRYRLKGPSDPQFALHWILVWKKCQIFESTHLCHLHFESKVKYEGFTSSSTY